VAHTWPSCESTMERVIANPILGCFTWIHVNPLRYGRVLHLRSILSVGCAACCGEPSTGKVNRMLAPRPACGGVFRRLTREPPSARLRAQSRVLHRQEGLLGLRVHQRAAVAAGDDRSSGGCRSCHRQLRSGHGGGEVRFAEGPEPGAEVL